MIIGTTPINEIIQDFIDSVDKAQSTKDLYKKTLAYWVRWCTENCESVRDIKIRDVVEYKFYLQKKGRSSATIDNYMGAIRSLYAWGVKFGYFNTNITETIKKERYRNRLYIKRSLSIDQVFNLLDHTRRETLIDKRNHAIIKLMVYTGLRCIEVQRLSCGDFRQSNDKWFLQIQRKGHRDSGQTIPVPDDIVKAINEYLLSRADEINERTPMFISHGPRNYENRINTVFISKMVKDHLRKAGYNGKEYTAHSLRHTAASLAHLAGAETYEIQAMLGHTNVNQTETYLKSLGFTVGIDGTAIWKIKEYAEKHKKNQQKPLKN